MTRAAGWPAAVAGCWRFVHCFHSVRSRTGRNRPASVGRSPSCSVRPESRGPGIEKRKEKGEIKLISFSLYHSLRRSKGNLISVSACFAR